MNAHVDYVNTIVKHPLKFFEVDDAIEKHDLSLSSVQAKLTMLVKNAQMESTYSRLVPGGLDSLVKHLEAIIYDDL